MDREDVEGLSSWEPGSILFTVRAPNAGLDVWSFETETGEAKALLTSTANESEPAYSAGRLAFVSDVSGREEVYVITSAAEGVPIQISNGGGRTPRWSPDGRSLYYRRENDLLSSDIENDEDFSGPPSLVWTMAVEAPYEILPDGGFLVAETRATPRTIVVVSNFTAELEPH